jgi:3-deoxy-D-manno-octulosonic-acid transferase
MVDDEQGLKEAVSELLANPSLRDEMGSKGVAFIEAHRGALEKNYNLIQGLSKIVS